MLFGEGFGENETFASPVLIFTRRSHLGLGGVWLCQISHQCKVDHRGYSQGSAVSDLSAPSGTFGGRFSPRKDFVPPCSTWWKQVELPPGELLAQLLLKLLLRLHQLLCQLHLKKVLCEQQPR